MFVDCAKRRACFPRACRNEACISKQEEECVSPTREGVLRYGATVVSTSLLEKTTLGPKMLLLCTRYAFAVAVLVEIPITVDRVVWDEVSWWALPAAICMRRISLKGLGPGGISSA